LGSNWKTLRLVASGACSASYNMALDEALSESARKGGSGPCLRTYGWDRPSVSLGYLQRSGDIDLSYCKQAGVPVVRRPTGGRAILHGVELTYSFSASNSLKGFGSGVLDCYAALSHVFMFAFKSLGLSAMSGSRLKKAEGPRNANPLCFSSASYGEISVSGRKIIGSAQRRWPDGFLQQGSIPLELDRERMCRVFGGVGSDLGLTALCELDSAIGLEQLHDAVVEGFRQVFDVEVVTGRPDKKEEELARKLQQEKYLLDQWTLKR